MNDPHKLPEALDAQADADSQSAENPNFDTVPGDPSPGVHSTVDWKQPERLGRYRIEKTLGEGGFGRVYQAYDEELKRHVAIKVPHPERISQPADVEQYLAEAQVLARLDHPGIVPVYDVGRSDDGLCYVVSKIIEGSDLAERIHTGRPSFSESAELVATVAEALHYAHTNGLVHRDVKEERSPCYKVEPLADAKPNALMTLRVELLPNGTGYRLPTEAEWEYACRAGTTTDFCFGDDEERLSRYGVFAAAKSEVPASKMCNRWGLFNMHGNVFEWCYDTYALYDGQTDTDPVGMASLGSLRVSRGGGWSYGAVYCRSAFRGRNAPDDRNINLGFRVARSPSGQQTKSSGAGSEGGAAKPRGAGKASPIKP